VKRISRSLAKRGDTQSGSFSKDLENRIKKKKKKHFLLTTQEKGVKTQSGGSYLESLYFELVEYMWFCLSSNP
jgi:hypothetical protein